MYEVEKDIFVLLKKIPGGNVLSNAGKMHLWRTLINEEVTPELQ